MVLGVRKNRRPTHHPTTRQHTHNRSVLHRTTSIVAQSHPFQNSRSALVGQFLNTPFYAGVTWSRIQSDVNALRCGCYTFRCEYKHGSEMKLQPSLKPADNIRK